jgi:DNA-binding transcriptional ArsR family regulator
MSRSAEPLSQDEVFDILSNSRRRYVLYYLRETGEPVELGELAEELAAWENDTPVEELTKQERKRVYVSLYQTHIQKLSEAGIVEYDQDTGMVSLGEGTDQIGAYLPTEDGRGEQRRWQAFYLLLAAASAITYALVALDVSVFGSVSEFVAGGAILVSFAALVAAHFFYTRRKESDMPAEGLIRNGR